MGNELAAVSCGLRLNNIPKIREEPKQKRAAFMSRPV